MNVSDGKYTETEKELKIEILKQKLEWIKSDQELLAIIRDMNERLKKLEAK